MKNSKFKIISIFCAFSLLGVLTTSVNAMKNENCGDKCNLSSVKDQSIVSDIEVPCDLKDEESKLLLDENFYSLMSDIFNSNDDKKSDKDNESKCDSKEFLDLKSCNNFNISTKCYDNNNKFNSKNINNNYNNKFNLNNINNNYNNNFNLKNINNNNNNFNLKNINNNGNFMNSNMMLYQNNFIKYEDKSMEHYKNKFAEISEDISYVIQKEVNYNNSELKKIYDMFFSEYKSLDSDYKTFLKFNQNKIYDVYLVNKINDIKKKLKNLSDIRIFRQLKWYKGRFRNISIDSKTMIDTGNYMLEDELLEKYHNLCKSYSNFLGANEGKTGEYNDLKNIISKLIKEIDGRKNLVDINKKIFSYIREFDDILKESYKIITEKKYEEKDDIIKCYDFLKGSYEKLFKECEDKINLNSEVYDRFCKIDREIRDKIALLAVFKDLAWKRVDFDEISKEFETLKENFNQILFNMKKDCYEQKVFEYKEAIESNKEIIDKVDYLKILKQEIFDIINDVDKKILEIGEKYNSN